MPNRIISDVTYESKKIRSVQPPDVRPEYAWLMPIVEDNGCFEYDPDAIWARAYALPRPGWTPEKVKAVLDEFIRAGLLLKYESNNHSYCYLVGSDKPGHLPATTKRYSTIPLPPGFPDERRPTAADGGERRAGNGTGNGFGIGFGKGNGTGSTDPSEPQNLSTPNGDATSLPQNSQPVTQNSLPSQPGTNLDDLIPADILYRHQDDVKLAWWFGELIKQTNPHRVRLGKQAVVPNRPNHWQKTWVSDFKRLLQAGYSYEQLQTMLKFVFGSDRWLPFMVRPAGFVKCAHQIAGDLRLEVHEIEPEPTPLEKAAARSKARDRRERDDYLKNLEEKVTIAELGGGVDAL
jgi:hypothetical protein